MFVPRKVFPDYLVPLANFHGHHRKALNKFGYLAPQIDVVLEVRDSRAPLSTTNVLFDKVLARKEKIILYSKKDLSIINEKLLKKWHESKNEQYLFVNGHSQRDCRRIIDLLAARYHQQQPPPPLGLRTMIIGMPNVGKSTLVNTLRHTGLRSGLLSAGTKKKRTVATVGAQPGVTRSTSEIIRVSVDPEIFVYDTPGVTLPTVKDVPTMLTLSLIGSVGPRVVDPVVKADYLLYLLNLQDLTGSKYREFIGHPTNNVHELLHAMATARNKILPDGGYHENEMANLFVDRWKMARSQRYRGMFDVEAILDMDTADLRRLYNEERARVEETNVGKVLTERLGPDGSGTAKNRRRTAKDREADQKNALFKL